MAEAAGYRDLKTVLAEGTPLKAGDKVNTGETLGSLHIDNNTSVLHFELWNGTAKQNPELWLKK